MRFKVSGFRGLSKGAFSLLGIFFLSASFATEVPIYDFSLKSYSQDIHDYFPSDSEDNEVPLLKPEYQEIQLHQFYNHYYSDNSEGLSPWSERMVSSIIPVVKKIELELLTEFDNQNKSEEERHYAENFKEHDERWLNRIKNNMNFPAIEILAFNEKNRAIAVNNTFARALPDGAPDFFYFTIPGQGFPFDNLQESVIWAGTPLYVFTVSQDSAWSLVLTPDAYFAWVKNSDVAYASNGFIQHWKQASKKSLVAITETEASIVNQRGHFQFAGYIGAVFPFHSSTQNHISILIPIKNELHEAVIQTGFVRSQSASLMPLEATKKI
ncbi:SH3 domain-containing protein [Legionella sp. PC997]|uniref:SH3 domain-containing protein n=1 Tax=Legionella sp. PC997 TaxID=2755562 RepID=UPI0018607740|nr:SH3 domain-containing protein [Legionella sp. PC997]QMT60260.1 hypothetical protein HBNCFIEN_01632 [Legionella sp. PC997]